MEENKVGRAIAYLRKRAGYTQKDLADRIGVSDKAVSKWERGMGLPDVSFLRNLSILLDTDTDSLLSGDVFHHDSSWSGVIVLDENDYKIGAATVVYDKPIIFFLLSYFLLVGIHDIAIVCTKDDKTYIDSILGDGKEYGINLKTTCSGLKSINTSEGNIMMVYGRCFLYGVDQTRFFQKAMVGREKLTMMVLPKKINHPSARIAISENKKIINSSSDEPLKTQYDFTDIPIIFFPSSLLNLIVKYKNIGEFLKHYAEENEMYVQMLDRGFVEIEIDDWNNVQEASTFLRIVQDKCGMNVYCLEEVAWRRGFISIERLRTFGDRYEGTEYGSYILSLYERIKEKSE